MSKRQTIRAPNRPQEGDLRPCPFCRGMMVFHEPRPEIDPGWFCGCGYEEFVRQTAKPSLKRRQRALKKQRVARSRKSTVLRARARRLARKSQSIRTSKSRRKK